MPKSLPSQVSNYASNQQRRPALLFDLGVSGGTLYFTSHNTDIVFDGHTYSAKAIEISSVDHGMEGQINRLSMKFDNVSKDMSAYASYVEFQGKPISIKRVYLEDVSGSTLYNEIFYGFMEAPDEVDKRWLSMSATEGKPLYKKALLDVYQRQCPWTFGDANCNNDGFANLSASSMYSEGAVSSGGTNYFIMTTGAGVTGTNDDVFNYGKVKIGYDGVTYSRTCKDYDAGTSRVTLNIGFPFTINEVFRFQVYKGCPKDYMSCGAYNAWGPWTNNQVNFRGFMYIGKNRDRAEIL